MLPPLGRTPPLAQERYDAEHRIPAKQSVTERKGPQLRRRRRSLLRCIFWLYLALAIHKKMQPLNVDIRVQVFDLSTFF